MLLVQLLKTFEIRVQHQKQQILRQTDQAVVASLLKMYRKGIEERRLHKRKLKDHFGRPDAK